MTIVATIFKGFPPLKAVRYVIAQILGVFVACFVIYVQYHDEIKAVTHALEAEGVLEAVNFTPQGIAGCFALYAPVGSSLGYVFFNEFVCVSAASTHQSPCCYLLSARPSFSEWSSGHVLTRPTSMFRRLPSLWSSLSVTPRSSGVTPQMVLPPTRLVTLGVV